MERQKKVVDASVIVKLFADEENSDKALLLRDKHINEEICLIAPEFILLEVINALKYKKLNEEILKKSNEELWGIQLKTINLDDSLIKKSIEISAKYNLSIYDSVYVALAEIHNAQLITADEKLLKLPNSVNFEKC